MEDFLRCLMSEGVHAVHGAPVPEPEGALCGALWLWVIVIESFRNEAQEVHEEVSLVFFQVASH